MVNPDAKLIEQAKKDPKAFDILYRKYSRKVYNYFLYRTGFREDLSEDLLQETFVRAYTHLRAYRVGKYSYLTYLLTIAHNLLVDHYRKAKHEIPVPDLDNIPVDINTPFEDADRRLALEHLWKALRDLPEEEREVILLHYREGMTLHEIAEIVGKSPVTVERWLADARQRLREHPLLHDLGTMGEWEHSGAQPYYLTS